MHLKYPFPILLALLLTSCQSADFTEPNADSSGIIDTHTHLYPLSEEINDEYVDTLVEVAKENGVSKIFLGLNARHEPDRPPTFSSIHDDWVLAAAERYPDIIIPALNGFDPEDPDAVDYVREQLETGKWKLIGELDLRNQVKKNEIPANGTIMMDIYALAAEYSVPVMVHYDFAYGTTRSEGLEEFENALDENPDTIFIYAHNCGPDIVKLMDAHPNLYCEHEKGPISSDVDMSRVVLGTDMQVHENKPAAATEQYTALIEQLRDSLSSWSEEDQKQAGYETALELFGL